MCATRAVDWQKSNSCPNEGSVELHFLPASAGGRSSEHTGSHQSEQRLAHRRITPVAPRGTSRLYIHRTDVELIQTNSIRAPGTERGVWHTCRLQERQPYSFPIKTQNKEPSSFKQQRNKLLRLLKQCWFVCYCSVINSPITQWTFLSVTGILMDSLTSPENQIRRSVTVFITLTFISQPFIPDAAHLHAHVNYFVSWNKLRYSEAHLLHVKTKTRRWLKCQHLHSFTVCFQLPTNTWRCPGIIV